MQADGSAAFMTLSGVHVHACRSHSLTAHAAFIAELLESRNPVSCSENKEKALLYFFLSASAGIILLLLACICYQCNARRRDREIAQTTRLEPAKSAELSSLIGSSNASPGIAVSKRDQCDAYTLVYLDSDSRLGVDISDLSSHGHYTRFTHVATPPRIPSNLHYYS